MQIVPADPAWQNAELIRLKNVIDRHPQAESLRQNDERVKALTSLRYLGTPNAARTMARLMQSTDNHTQFECMSGLVGSPSRSIGLEEMRRLLTDPDFAVNERFLSTMALLPLDPSSPFETLSTQREQNLKQLQRELVEALPKKRGMALTLSIDAALSGSKDQIPASFRQKMAKQLIASFDSLPVEAKINWLQGRWNDVKGPEWIPLLRSAAELYTFFPVPNEMHAYRSLQLSAAALTNWYQLDPENARDAVIAEMKRPNPRFGGATLGLLPDQTLPDIEYVMARHFVEATDYNVETNLASLLFRYADGQVLLTVLPKIESLVGKWACAPQTNALAYVLKVDRSAAEPLIERALASRSQTACWHSLPTDVGALEPSPVLDKFAVAALADGDAELETNAARYLGRWGSSSAEQHLWARYVEWSQQWKGRDAELRFSPLGPQTHVWDANLGKELIHALAGGQRWFADGARLRQIRDLAPESMKQEIDAYIREDSRGRFHP